ncbi:hypothetical protein ACT7DE_00025 [Bacillus paranthracis]
MDHTLKDTKNAIFFVEKDGKPVKIAAVKDVEFNFNIESKQSVEIPREISISCKFRNTGEREGINGHGIHPTASMEYSFSFKVVNGKYFMMI